MYHLILAQIALTTLVLSGTISSNSKQIFFKPFSYPVEIVILPTNSPEFVGFVLTSDNKLKVNSNATLSCTNCILTKDLSLLPGETNLGHAWAYNDKTWHSYIRVPGNETYYLKWLLGGPTSGIASFTIYRSALSDGTFFKIATYNLAPPNYIIYSDLIWRDINLIPKAKAFYKVTSNDVNGKETLTSNTVQMMR